MSLGPRTLSILAVGAVTLILRGSPPADSPPLVVQGVPGFASASAVINFSELAAREAERPATAQKAVSVRRGRIKSPPSSSPSSAVSASGFPELLAPSPSTASSFLALDDNHTSFPPDTHGAVGTNHVMTVLNTQVRIQNRNGGVISTVSLNSFWSAVGGNPDCFDPKLLYDPFNHRWIFTACANPELSTSAVLLGVSQTGDPTGTWFLFKVDADPANLDWADYPSLGFNKNWIVVSVNLFPISGSGFDGVNIYAFNKTNAYAGQLSFSKLQDLSGVGFALVPAITYDNTNTTEYLLEDFDGTAGQLRMSKITGTPAAAVLTLNTSRPTTSSWGGGFGDFLPQLGTTTTIDGGDSRMQNVVQRNGKLWATHSIYRSSPNRAAVQWWQITTNGTVLQVGRIDDATGSKHFSYPTLAVNSNEDMLIGYSRFGSTQYVSANYSFRNGTDPVNTLHDDTVLKAGEGIYFRAGGDVNRWGDYSSTVMDPVNDMSIWTIQEYAATPVNPPTVDGNGRFGTWWGRFDIGVESAALVSSALIGESCPPTNGLIDPGESVTLSFTLKNAGSINITNLVATLQSGTGVLSPSAPQIYGALPVGGTNVAGSFTFIATGSCGGLVTTRIQLQDGAVNLGTLTNSFSLGPPMFAENFDALVPPAIPAGWTNFKSGGGSLWVTTNAASDSAPYSLFAGDPIIVSDEHITSPPVFVSTTNALIAFRHKFDFEQTYDGGVLEIAIGAGGFSDITNGGAFVTNGYNASIRTGFGNPLAGRLAWSGTTNVFITSTARLPAAAAGQNVRFRWRAGADQSNGGAGWYVDSISLLDTAACCSGGVTPNIVNVRRVADNFAFSFASTAGQIYDVEYKGSLNVSNWQTLQTIIGDGTLKSVTNTLSDTNQFFRLKSP